MQKIDAMIKGGWCASYKEMVRVVRRETPTPEHSLQWTEYERLLMFRVLASAIGMLLFDILNVANGTSMPKLSEEFVADKDCELCNYELIHQSMPFLLVIQAIF